MPRRRANRDYRSHVKLEVLYDNENERAPRWDFEGATFRAFVTGVVEDRAPNGNTMARTEYRGGGKTSLHLLQNGPISNAIAIAFEIGPF